MEDGGTAASSNDTENFATPLANNTTTDHPSGSCIASNDTSSPKVPIYTNLVSVDQRSSPTSYPGRSGTPASTGTGSTLQLKLNPTSALPGSGDVYEFHSSPEDADGTGFFPSTSTLLLPKNASAIIPNIGIDSQQPPQKRIKTAILAKKLLAAAADSNIIDSIGTTLSVSSQNQNRKNLENELATDNASEEMEEKCDEVEEEDDGASELVKEDEEDEQKRTNEEEEGARSQRGRANTSTSVLVQEQKKVPPLRISLLKTPSEEGAEGGSGVQISPQQRRNRGGRVGGRRIGPRKDDLQRVTRSRVRQIGFGDDPEGGSSGRKRRYRPGESVGLLEEEDAVSSNAEEAEESAGMGQANAAEDELRSEDSQQSAKTAEGGANVGGAATTEKTGGAQQQSVAASILSKNSLEQSVAFEAMIRDKWIRQYKAHLELVTEQVEQASLDSQPEPGRDANPDNCYEGALTKNWPESLQKLYTEQAKRSQQMTEAHRLDRERIQKMAQRELAKAKESLRQHKVEGERTEKRRNFMTIVSMLRDSECYDPGLFMEESSSSTRKVHNHPSLTQVQQRFTYLANTTKNRHVMEAHALAENHKAEWNRALRKIVRQNERQQMLKGSVGGRKQPQQHHLPFECCSDSVVPVVKVADITFSIPQIDIT